MTKEIYIVLKSVVTYDDKLLDLIQKLFDI